MSESLYTLKIVEDSNEFSFYEYVNIYCIKIQIKLKNINLLKIATKNALHVSMNNIFI